MATAQRNGKPSVFSNRTLEIRRGQACTSPFFFTCETKERVKECTGKAPPGFNAPIGHMHGEHSAYSNPTCALFSIRLTYLGFIVLRLQSKNGEDANSASAAVTTLAF